MKQRNETKITYGQTKVPAPAQATPTPTRNAKERRTQLQ